MEKIYCPWRQIYSKLTHERHAYTKATCIFCAILQHPEDDAQNFVVKRLTHCAVLMNLYPYSAGHLLVLPYKHAQHLADFNASQQADILHALTLGTQWLQATSQPDGFNIGLNLGKAAGAGIPEHLHWHLLPRWQGDTNFMPLLADTKQVSFDLRTLYEELVVAAHQTL